jgi:hypothetical protein
MLMKRMVALSTVFTVAALAACVADDDTGDDADIIMQDTVVRTDVETVEVPVQTTDTAVVRTEVQVDTTVETDTIEEPR